MAGCVAAGLVGGGIQLADRGVGDAIGVDVECGRILEVEAFDKRRQRSGCVGFGQDYVALSSRQVLMVAAATDGLLGLGSCT
jgi:hypothetical protein